MRPSVVIASPPNLDSCARNRIPTAAAQGTVLPLERPGTLRADVHGRRSPEPPRNFSRARRTSLISRACGTYGPPPWTQAPSVSFHSRTCPHVSMTVLSPRSKRRTPFSTAFVASIRHCIRTSRSSRRERTHVRLKRSARFELAAGVGRFMEYPSPSRTCAKRAGSQRHARAGCSAIGFRSAARRWWSVSRLPERSSSASSTSPSSRWLGIIRSFPYRRIRGTRPCGRGPPRADSGVATAAGLCFGSLGTDTGGSIRFPSAACGIVGLKPSYGRVSRQGVFPLGESLDHIGPMTRTVADAAAMPR